MVGKLTTAVIHKTLPLSTCDKHVDQVSESGIYHPTNTYDKNQRGESSQDITISKTYNLFKDRGVKNKWQEKKKKKKNFLPKSVYVSSS